MMLCRALDAMAVDYGKTPSELVRMGLADLAFDVAVREKARAQ
jgi:hypothetical protein